MNCYFPKWYFAFYSFFFAGVDIWLYFNSHESAIAFSNIGFTIGFCCYFLLDWRGIEEFRNYFDKHKNL